MKRIVTENLKNLPGWKTNRKPILFSIDVYGNVLYLTKEVKVFKYLF